MHPHLYELDYVNTVIRQNHRAAFDAERARAGTDSQPGIMATPMSVRERIAFALTGTMARLTRMPSRNVAPTSPCAPAQR